MFIYYRGVLLSTAFMENSMEVPKRKVYNTKCLHKNLETSQINDLMMHLKTLGKQKLNHTPKQ